MNFVQVLRQINDLPDTFTRPGTTYEWLANTLSQYLSDYTNNADGTASQGVNFQNAQWGWLDVWGLLLDLPRYDGESDVLYKPRITETLAAWVGTFPAIVAWGQFFFNQPIEVAEVNPYGYTITIPAGIPVATIQRFIISLLRIRPIGIPFAVTQAQGDLYLDTIVYLDAMETAGSYISAGSNTIALTGGTLTTNVEPLLPDLYFTDPTLNPG